MTIPLSAYYRVHGLTVSYFTRKITAYLDYHRLPWWLEPSIGGNPQARDLGWNGGIPVITTPAGEMIWDSTDVLLHLDTFHRHRTILPENPVTRFLAFALDDFSDEWLYRHAVGTRWLREENAISGSWDISREGSLEIPREIDVEARSPELDAILERAGIASYYADYAAQATSVPDPVPLPRPADNQPYRAG
jgi:glutathione S-transferase